MDILTINGLDMDMKKKVLPKVFLIQGHLGLHIPWYLYLDVLASYKHGTFSGRPSCL